MGEFVKDLTGSNILLLTQINPFRLVILLEKSKIRVPAKGGDIATGDIMIPAGKTNIPPGPVIGEVGGNRGPTKIEGRSIRGAQKTRISSKRNKITPKKGSC